MKLLFYIVAVTRSPTFSGVSQGSAPPLGQRFQLIGVDRLSSAANPECRPNAQALKNDSLAADQRRFWPEPRDSAFKYRFFRALRSDGMPSTEPMRSAMASIVAG